MKRTETKTSAETFKAETNLHNADTKGCAETKAKTETKS